MNRRLIPTILRVISIGLYLYALTQPCFDTQNEAGDNGEGMALVISGLFGLFTCAAGFTWLANPALWISWLTMRSLHKISLFFNLASLILSLLFLDGCQRI